MRALRSVFFFFMVVGWLSASDTVSLAGEWGFRLDPMDVGVRQKWFNSEFTDRVLLPGTTDLNARGFVLDRDRGEYLMSHSGRETEVQVLRTQWPGTHSPGRADEAEHLVRDYFYVGKAWYQKQITIPADWEGKNIRLRLERVLWQSHVWVDSRPAGSYDSLVAEHPYDLGTLKPGTHRLTICVDNGMVHNIGILGHSYGPETQSRWNGIVGDIELSAQGDVALARPRIYPAPGGDSLRVLLEVRNATGAPVDTELSFEIRDAEGKGVYGRKRIKTNIAEDKWLVTATVEVTKPVRFWNEFQPVRYQLVIKAGDLEVSERFGFRHVAREKRAIHVNGRRVFLRGTLDCALYPKTGHPPMTVEEWLGVLRTVKDYGFNHVRFHTWCPPEAAFEAADQLGVYLAPETPFWVDNWTVQTSSHPKLLGSDEGVVKYVRNEIDRISEAYGNHPSFAFFSIGNEFGMDSDWQVVDKLLSEAKQRDPRRLYNATSARRTVGSDDFWVTHAVGKRRVRGVGPPRTNWDFSEALRGATIPVVSHETGQRPIFPDFRDLLSKLNGPLKPYNLARLQRSLDIDRQSDRTEEFRRASARFQYVQYKAEHEALHRSSESAGYQLLMLTDFTGQSEALVGILDPFRDEKGFVTREEVLRWNAPTVLLARFPRYTLTTGESFSAEIEIAHFGPTELKGADIDWSLGIAGGRTVAEGRIGPVDVSAGGRTKCGEITVRLEDVLGPERLTFEVSAGEIVNKWPVWVYPELAGASIGGDVVVVRDFDESARSAIAAGKSVLFLAHGLRNASARETRFESVYWSAGWWGDAFSSLGIVCDPSHPALAAFPNEGHSDWQWHELTRNATSFLLAGTPEGYRPIVQLVPDYHYNRLLGQVFEARVGPGRLLVCGYDLTSDLDKRIAARQMRRSLLSYMNSEAFQPDFELSLEYLAVLLQSGS